MNGEIFAPIRRFIPVQGYGMVAFKAMADDWENIGRKYYYRYIFDTN